MRVLERPGGEGVLTAALALLAVALVLALGGRPDRGGAIPGTRAAGNAPNPATLGGVALWGGTGGASALNIPGMRSWPAPGAPLSLPGVPGVPQEGAPQSRPAAGTDAPASTSGLPFVGTTTEDGINVRAGPATDYRIVFQLPAGTRVRVVAEQPGWYHVATLWQTEGWVAADYLKVGPETVGDAQPPAIGSAGVVGVVNLRAGPGTGYPSDEQLTDGSVLQVLELQGDWYKVRSPSGTIGWVAAEYVPLDWIPDAYGGSAVPSGGASSDVVRIAQKYLGARYVWGGSYPSGFDCSGLTWYAYGQVGVWLPGGSAQQFSSDYGRYIGSISALVPGDLVFFERTTDEAGITHVGIYAGDGKMIAARSERLGVRYVSLSDPFWSSRFAGGIRPYR